MPPSSPHRSHDMHRHLRILLIHEYFRNKLRLDSQTARPRLVKNISYRYRKSGETVSLSSNLVASFHHSSRGPALISIYYVFYYDFSSRGLIPKCIKPMTQTLVSTWYPLASHQSLCKILRSFNELKCICPPAITFSRSHDMYFSRNWIDQY